MTIRVGLIGAGRQGLMHVPGLAAMTGVQVAAVCDSDRALAEQAAGPFGATAHINFRTLIESERLDAVFVCLPPYAQGEPETLAARAGIHLCVAGPVAVAAEKARDVRKEIENAGVISSVWVPWRYLSGVDRAREALKGWRIALARGWCFGAVPPAGWRRRKEASGGYFVQEAFDLLDLMLYLCGDAATVSATLSEGIVAGKTGDADIEDALSAVLRFRSGAVGEMTAAAVASRHDRGLAVVADGVEVRVDGEGVEIIEPGAATRLDHAGSALAAAQEAFIRAVQTGKRDAVRCDYASATRTLEVALAAVEAARTGKVVPI